METTELLWFTVCVSGFVVFLEGAVTFLVEKLFKGKLRDITKVITGLAIFSLAILKLFKVF